MPKGNYLVSHSSEYEGNATSLSISPGAQTSLSVSALEYLGLSPSPQPPRSESTCNFRELPKRYEQTLARNRIQLTRRAFPLKESKVDFEPFEKINGHHDFYAGDSKNTYRLYNKPLLTSNYDHETPFQRFVRERRDNLNQRNSHKSRCVILPEIVKLSPQSKTPLKSNKRAGTVHVPPPTPVRFSKLR